MNRNINSSPVLKDSRLRNILQAIQLACESDVRRLPELAKLFGEYEETLVIQTDRVAQAPGLCFSYSCGFKSQASRQAWQ